MRCSASLEPSARTSCARRRARSEVLKRALGILICLLAATSTACAKAVDNWADAMAGHAAVSRSSSFERRAPPDYRDCNGNVLDGQETDVRTSSAHCGACGARCDGTCDGGVCSPRSAGPSAHDASADWRLPTKPLTVLGPIDVSTWGDAHQTLLPAFAFDTDPVESWRYDGCEKSGVCKARQFLQPDGSGPSAPAVGMRREDAAAFCRELGMLEPTPAQEKIIRASSPPRIASGIDASFADRIVTDGFRCARPAISH
jgi:hypothetical protein